MDNKISKLIELVQKLPEDCLDETIEFISEKIEENSEKSPSLHVRTARQIK